MAFTRRHSAARLATGDELTSAMVAIGMLFAAAAADSPNIEDTLVGAAVEGMERDSLRVLSVLTTWLGVHHQWVNADRLYRAVKSSGGPRNLAYWAAISKWLEKDHRFRRLGELYKGPRLDLLSVGTEFHIGRQGEDSRFVGTPLRVPAGVLRDRITDVLPPRELARRHRVYRQRVLQGPSYRADMWAEVEADPRVSAAELARRTYGSFGTARQVKQDWALLHDAARCERPKLGSRASRRKAA